MYYKAECSGYQGNSMLQRGDFLAKAAKTYPPLQKEKHAMGKIFLKKRRSLISKA